MNFWAYMVQLSNLCNNQAEALGHVFTCISTRTARRNPREKDVYSPPYGFR